MEVNPATIEVQALYWRAHLPSFARQTATARSAQRTLNPHNIDDPSMTLAATVNGQDRTLSLLCCDFGPLDYMFLVLVGDNDQMSLDDPASYMGITCIVSVRDDDGKDPRWEVVQKLLTDFGDFRHLADWANDRRGGLPLAVYILGQLYYGDMFWDLGVIR